ncbi:hypothetical protein [Paenibacillus puerhi]|uniref:hypothetical protein n=1 Tax=Paenibacillus puerhi TaxID=2692622 RepID=UPI001356BC14|nr:hypothetical protein [Paenibacillus puerhi]
MQWIPDLLTMECKLSVTSIDGRRVQTKQAKVRLTHLDGEAIRFVSQLSLPTHRRIIVSLELALPWRTVVFTGTLAGRISAGGVHRYTAIHRMDESSRRELLQLIRQRNEYRELQRDKAADSYLSFHPANTKRTLIDKLA